MSKFKVFILTHGDLCKEYCNFFKYVAGEELSKYVISLPLKENMKPKEYMADIREVLDDAFPFFLTDIYGGTPDNIAKLLVNEIGKGFVISGINIPMLMEVLKIETYKSPEEIKDKFINSGKNGIR